MGKNLLVINVDIRETRVALIENGIIAELHIERETSKGTLGNIYLGKVSRVLPGMQAAFIDVGLERAAFLHVEDLIRPDDFEAYLSGHRRGSDDERSSGREAATTEEEPAAAPAAARPVEAAEEAAGEDGEVDIELPTALEVADTGDEPAPEEPFEEEAAAEAEVEAEAYEPVESVPPPYIEDEVVAEPEDAS